MVADPREMQENQGFSENRIDKLEFSLLSFQNETFHLEIAHRFYRKTFLNHLGQDEIY